MSKVTKLNIEDIVDIDDSKLHKNDEYEIKYWGYSRSFSELIEMYMDDEIIIPSLQRDYIWKHKEASLLIDSILRGLPLPSIFITEIGKKYVLIDGLQRLHTVYLFTEGLAHENWKISSREFILMNSSDIGGKWRGLSYQGLTIEQPDSPMTGPYESSDLKVYLPEIKEIFAFTNYYGDIEQPMEFQWYKFTAPLSGYYEFYTLGNTDTYGDFFNDIVVDLSTSGRLFYDDNSGIGDNFKKKIYLSSGQTIYLRVKGGTTTETGEYTLRVIIPGSC